MIKVECIYNDNIRTGFGDISGNRLTMGVENVVEYGLFGLKECLTKIFTSSIETFPYFISQID